MYHLKSSHAPLWKLPTYPKSPLKAGEDDPCTANSPPLGLGLHISLLQNLAY